MGKIVSSGLINNHEFNVIQFGFQTRCGKSKPMTEIWRHLVNGLTMKNSEINEKNNRKDLVKYRYRIYLDNPDVYFTRREGLTMAYFLRGKTMKEAAKLQNISPRTVEAYAKKMREKLNCKSKEELIEKVKLTDFYKKFLTGGISQFL